MNSWTKLNKNESGQAALEAAIILIAFVVVASVFAFAVLSAGTASTQRSEQSIYSGLKNVESSMTLKGAVIAEKDTGATVKDVIFDIALASGGDPVNMQSTNPVVIIAYRDNRQQVTSLTWTKTVIQGDTDDLLETNELMEITATVPVTGTGTYAVGPNQAFSLEVKPPNGAVLQINRTTPPQLDAFSELR